MRSFNLRLAPIVGLGLLIVLTLPGVAAASTKPNLSMFVPAIGGSCIYIAAPANQTLSLKWTSASGATKESASVATDSGDPMFCSADDIVAVGDKIRVSNGVKAHKLTIPNISAAINRVTDVMHGTAPAGDTIRVECGGSPFGQFEPCQFSRKVAVNSAGHFSTQIPFDMFGGFVMYATWKSSFGDFVSRKTIVPYFEVFIGQARFFGVTQPLSTASVSVEDASHAGKGSGSGQSGPLEGSFVGKLRDSAHQVVKVEPGDFASSDVASDATFQVPEIQATATASNNRVVGHCEVTDSYRDVFVLLYRNGRLRGAGGAADNFGNFDFDFSHDFPDPVNVRVGDTLYIECIQGEGDRAVKVIVAQ